MADHELDLVEAPTPWPPACWARLDDCRDRFPVRFDGAGTARFQYLVVASAEPGGCGPRSGCVLRLGAGGRSSVVALVFGRRVGPGAWP